MVDDISRRQFFRLTPIDYLKSDSAANQSHLAGADVVRPPGALASEDDFLAACERCGACARACPHGVISHFGPASGLLEKTPRLEPESNPCRWCSTMDCIKACPSGALRREVNGTVGAIGKAKLRLDQCLNSEGILCDTCVQYCPSEIGAIRMNGHSPQLDHDRCVGCGLCAFYCDASPAAIDMVAIRSGGGGE
jgi:ferredoxin-type protein NapG